MAVRIRVYPNNGLGGAGGYGTNALTNRLYSTQLSNERKTSNLRLTYERALWTERLKQAQLQAQVQYGGYGAAGYGAAVASPFGYGAAMPGAFGLGGVPAGFSQVPGMGMGYSSFGQGMPGLAGAAGQTNITNQSAVGAANQSVTNSNTYSNYVMNRTQAPFAGGLPFGSGYGGYGYGNGSGGLLSGLLGALI